MRPNVSVLGEIINEAKFNPFFAYWNSRPLLHQTELVARSLFVRPTRILIADVIGLGKTITALRILRLHDRYKRLRRVLIIVPSILIHQWRRELRKMGLPSEILTGYYIKRWPNLPEGWYIGSMDTLKSYVDVLKKLEWDAIVVDEVHKLGIVGNRENLRLSNLKKLIHSNEKSILLLLTATPHRGDPKDYLKRLSLIDPGIESKLQELNDPKFYLTTHNTIVYRRDKKDINEVYERREIFKPCDLIAVLIEPTEQEKLLIDGVVDLALRYLSRFESKVLEEAGFGEARFLIQLLRAILIKRGLSSPRALINTFEALTTKRTKILEYIRAGMSYREALRRAMKELEEITAMDFFDEEEELDLRLRKIMENFEFVFEESPQSGRINEKLTQIMDIASDIIRKKKDSKVETLKKILLESFNGEGDLGSGKVIIFTEFVDTAEYIYDILKEWLDDMGYKDSIRILTSKNKNEAEEIQRWLEGQGKRILVATDVAGEGLNIQSANILVNYEITWSPIKLEQRIGRIWRYGQRRRSYVFNLFLTHSLEGKVARVVFAKLYNITLSIPKMEQIIGEKVMLSTLKNQLFEDEDGSRILVPAEIEFRGKKRKLTDADIINMIAVDAQGFVEAFLRELRALKNVIRTMKVYPTSQDHEAISSLLRSLTGFSENEDALYFVRRLTEIFAEIEKYTLEYKSNSLILRKYMEHEIKLDNPEKALNELRRLLDTSDRSRYYFFNDEKRRGIVLARVRIFLGDEEVYRELVGIDLDGGILRGPELADAMRDLLPRSIPVDEIYGFEDVLKEVNRLIALEKNTLYYDMERGIREILDSLRWHDMAKGWNFFETREPQIEIEPLTYILGNRFLPMPGEVPNTTVMGWAEREAEELVIEVERSQGRKAERVSETQHYDIRSEGDDEVRFIEVKSRIQGNDIKIKLTPMEGEFASKEPRSWLYIVFGLRSENPVILAIKNPIKRLPFRVKEQIIVRGDYELII